MRRARPGLAIAPEVARGSHRRALEHLASALEAAFDPNIDDGVWIVRIPEEAGSGTVLFRTRDAAVDDLLRFAHDIQEPAIGKLAAELLVGRRPPRACYPCALVGRGAASLTMLRRPGPDPAALERAQERIAALCLEQRGLLPREGPPKRRGFAIRAHRCSVCTSWAMALDERGFDLTLHTAPTAARAMVRSVGSSALCLRCLADLREAFSLARDALGLDKPRAAAAVMPRAVLPRLDRIRAQRSVTAT
jgi:hypothetical protein